MKSKKNICIGMAVVVIVAIAMLALTGFRLDNYLHKSIYNDNSKIVKINDAYNIKSINRNLEGNNYFADFDIITGKKTILMINAYKKSTLVIDYDSLVEGGKLKAVFVSEDNNITTIFEQSKRDKCTIEIPKGEGRIKLIGDDATGKIKMTFKIESDINIYMP